jgi:hypothetical protein
MSGDGDTVGEGHVDSGVELSPDKSLTLCGIRSLVLMMVDGSSSLVRLVRLCSKFKCVAISTRSSAVDKVSLGLVFEKSRLLTGELSCALEW